MIHARAFRCGADMKPEEVRRKAVLANKGSFVQTADAGSATNEFFVEMLAAQTLKAEETGSLLARKPEVDFLLRLAGTTQISKAINERGAAEGRPFLLVVAGRRKPKGRGGLEGIELPRRGLTRAEMEKVERAALLDAQRA
ncbi:MAG: hypothetical protein JRN08_06775 [Nitrososphaerota archaeon]|nr:hypothetical protein [Nitrososphaerota archaeon]